MKGFDGCRVLLADDDEISREIAAEIVRNLGADCEFAADGDALLARLADAAAPAVDLVLTDIHMPGKGGIEACSEFRASEDPRARTLPFIGMTADTDGALFDRAISAGMNSMTMKPIRADVLRAHFTLTLRDNRANAVFREHVQLALDAAKAKSYFFSTVSHDIRTPLNAIIGFSQMLKVGFRSEEERERAVDSIIVSGTTLLKLVNDVLDLSKLESGKMTINPEPVDCAALVREIVESFRVSNANPRLAIRGDIQDVPPLMVDPQRLRQILFNLVGNAAKFTEEGHVEVRLRFSQATDGRSGALRIEVEDTGCGISAADLEKIASPYVQLGNGRSRHGGTGLGLAITKQLLAAMGGELGVASELGRGSVFSVSIPKAAVADEAPAKPEGSRLDATPPLVADEALARLRVLIVDDVKVNLLVLRTMLAKLGVSKVATAQNGAEARNVMAGSPFDLVLTDMWMPVMDGEGLARAIRGDPATASLPVYAVTADVELGRKHADAGFTGILLKPITLETLGAVCAEVAAGASGASNDPL